MDFDALRTLPGTTQEELDRIKEGILALPTSETKHYTWEEKIESLVKLAKAAGRYTNAMEVGSDYYHDARRALFDAYADFCEWRHEGPYVVDEIKALIENK